MEIDLNELELYEKQLAERRRLRQQHQSTAQTVGSSSSSQASTSTLTTRTTPTQNVDEIDAYLDRLALDLQTKDQRTDDAWGANHPHDQSQPAHLAHNENASQLIDDCDRNGHADAAYAAAAVPSNSNQAAAKTTLPMLIYAFLSILAYVNTITCKIYTHTHTRTINHNTLPHSCHIVF